ncbi:GNAT family N-acetyltransferase [Vibrio intestinalis]|uniref:GNAT family N-acetyltransferase n=1 Tax=Vibrio intestinalis TaxID=2933291 RepID=UPI0021A94D50|nr:GNAT family N-acetyltransferase [Vibrio intestinalis]
MHSVFFEPDAQQFRVHLQDEQYAVVAYEPRGEVLAITSTKVPEDLQGKGYGKVMMEAVLPEIEKMGKKVEPVCSFVVVYFERNPQWQHLKA